MNSKLLHFLFVLCCAALIGLGPIRAQNSTPASDSNGNAVTAPARQSDAGHSAVSPSSAASNDAAPKDAQRAANDAVDNDRGTVVANPATHSGFNAGWLGILGLVGLLGLLGLLRRKSDQRKLRRAGRPEEQSDFRRAA